MSRCSALHDSLLPNGEPSSFFGFGDMADGPEYDDEYDDEEAGWEEVEGGDEHDNDNNEDQQDGGGVSGGRVRSDFHSGGGPGARFAPY